MSKLIKKAFTLIELLVVIAIIGILSGLIIVAMGGITNSANIAKAKVFSNSLRNVLLMSLVSEWKFDGSGVADGGAATTSYTQDTWSGGNNCTIGSSPTVYSSLSCINGSCLKFNGTTDYLDCGAGLASIIGDLTIAGWVNLGNVSTDQDFVSTHFGKNDSTVPYHVFITNTSVDLRLGNGTNQYTGRFSGITASSWHFIAGTVSGNTISMYVDGVLGSTIGTFSGSRQTGTKLTIGAGSTTAGDRNLTGLIDEVRIYTAAMPTSQIKEQYYAGLNNLFGKGRISKEEYIKLLASR